MGMSSLLLWVKLLHKGSIMDEIELSAHFNNLTQSQRDYIQREIIDFGNINNCLDDNRVAHFPYCYKETKIIKKGFAHCKQRCLYMGANHKFTYDSHLVTSFLKVNVDDFVKIYINTIFPW